MCDRELFVDKYITAYKMLLQKVKRVNEIERCAMESESHC